MAAAADTEPGWISVELLLTRFSYCPCWPLERLAAVVVMMWV